MSKLPRRSAVDLAAALRSKEFSAVELLDACLEEVDRHNESVNAIVWRDDDAARAAARAADERIAAGDDAPFLGVPIPIKDLTEVTGQPCTYGSRGASDSPVTGPSEMVVDSLVDAGFVLACRTNTPEFGHITAAENLRYGITRNPFDLDRTPGGSSGGAAASVAAGMFPLAHANDGGGSIRIPASCCGLVGLKPSRGRIPRRAQSWLGAVVEGVVNTTVLDAAATLDVLAIPDPYAWYNTPVAQRPFRDEVGTHPGKLRIGLMSGGPGGMPVEPVCTEAVEMAGRALEGLGHDVTRVEVATVSEELIGPFILLVGASLGEYAGATDLDNVEPHIAAEIANAKAADSFSYAAAARAIELLARDLTASWGRDFDLLVTPTMGISPAPAGAIMGVAHENPGEPSELVVATVAFTAFANVTGQPAVSLPLHQTETGVPVGVQVVGRPFGEAELLRVSAQLEEALPWADRVPDLDRLAATS